MELHPVCICQKLFLKLLCYVFFGLVQKLFVQIRGQNNFKKFSTEMHQTGLMADLFCFCLIQVPVFNDCLVAAVAVGYQGFEAVIG